MLSLTKCITNIFIRNSVANEDEKTIIAYGLEALLYKALHLGVAVIIGILFGKAMEILVFHLFYQKLRTYAGGHHAKSNIVCFICSCCITVATLAFWTLCPKEYQIWCTTGFVAVSFPIIWILSPVGAISKPLDEVETLVYRKKARTFLAIEIVGVASLVSLGLVDIALTCSTALFTLSIMLVLGKIKNVFNSSLSAETEE